MDNKNLKFERKWGIPYVLMSIFIPVPFVGIFSILQLIVFYLALTVGIEYPEKIAAAWSIAFSCAAAILFGNGYKAMFSGKRYGDGWLWIRLFCYFFLTLIY